MFDQTLFIWLCDHIRISHILLLAQLIP